MQLDLQFVKAMLAGGMPTFTEGRDGGITPEMLFDDGRKILEYAQDFLREHGKLPDIVTIQQKFGEKCLEGDAPEPLPFYMNQILDRRKGRLLGRGLKGALDALSKGQTVPALAETKKAVLSVEAVGNVTAQGLINLVEPAIVTARIDAYNDLKSLKGEIDGIPWPWPSLNKITRGYHNDELWMFIATKKTGKCLAAGTEIQDPNTGEWVKIEDFVSEKRSSVLSNGTCGISAHPVTDHIHNGRKPVFRVVTRLGNEIRATENHPLLTASGWVALRDISPGTRIAAISHIPSPTIPTEIPWHELDVLAMMLAEGGTSGTRRATFTNQTPEIVAAMNKALEPLDCVLKKRGHHPANWVIFWNKNTGHHDKTPVRELIERHGFWGTLSKNRWIPKSIFSCPDQQVARFLGLLWACDGTVDKRGGVPCYTSASKNFAIGVQRLLLRFGIVSRIRERSPSYDGGNTRFKAYEVSVRGQSLPFFWENIKIPGPKGTLSSLSLGHRPKDDVIPRSAALDARITQSFERYGKPWAALWRDAGLSPGNTLLRDPRWVSRTLFTAFCKTTNSQDIAEEFAPAGITWDEVVSITADGDADVYDLTVPVTHNFVANGLVVHNSFAQVICALHAWDHCRAPILLVSEEMGVWKIARRWDAIRSELPYSDFLAGKLDTNVENRWRDDMVNLMTKDYPPFWVAGKTRVKTVADLELLIEETRPAAVFVDAAYFLDVGSGSEGKWERTSKIVDQLQDIPQKKHIPIVASWQFNRHMKGGEDVDSDPLENVGFAFEVAQACDGAIGMFRSREYREENKMLMRLLAVREGQDMLPLVTHWDFGNMNFKEIGVLDGEELIPTDKGDVDPSLGRRKTGGGGPLSTGSAQDVERSGRLDFGSGKTDPGHIDF